ncbi:hypothetical protein [Psychroserpens mesophilus]|uniref:hypothetical protein n=1 Tax=Psychroserpens mesophilus TaxID=325473 RepID=UPI003D64C091
MADVDTEKENAEIAKAYKDISREAKKSKMLTQPFVNFCIFKKICIFKKTRFMKNITQLLLLTFTILLFHNCEKDDFDSQNNNDPDLNTNDLIFQSEHFGNTTSGNFIGLVTNETGEKLENVQITIGNAMVSTDRNGLFVLNDVAVFENFAYIKAYKNGYINGSRVVIPKENGVNRINIVLLEKEVTATVNSGEPSTVYKSGASVNFTGDFITSDGTIYNGQVEVVLHYIRPNDNSTFTQMPGSLFAQTSTNDAVALETYGMLSVKLFSPSGEALNIDENNPATIEYPIHYTQTDIAPETMNLWYFDDTVGYWKEEGQAIKSENKYIAEVTHFTWWNCDLPLEYVNLCFSITSGTSEASTPYNVSITRNSNNQLIYNGTLTSQDGFECGLVPINEEITVTVYSAGGQCYSQLVHEEVLNGFSSDANVDISFSENIQTTTITGTVTNCDGNPLTNGYVYFDENNTFSITDGIINIGIQHCSIITTQLQIFDYNTGQWSISDDIILNGGTINLETSSTCGNTGGIYNGNIQLKTQLEVDNFGLFNYSSINGNFIIADFENPTDINNLTPLIGLESIDGSLIISGNSLLENLNGLNNITDISGSFRIENNDLLISLTGLNNLANVGSFSLSYNDNLSSTEGLNSLVSISYELWIYLNDSLFSLDNFNNITSLVNLTIRQNESLTSLTGLENLNELVRLKIYYNDALTTLAGLEQITQLDRLEIAGNQELSDLNGLGNLISITNPGGPNVPTLMIGLEFSDSGYLYGPNPNLTNFCALEELFINGNGTSIETFIDYNAYNPTPQDIIDGNCSQ